MDRRGVSPVIAVLLLIVIAVAAAVLTYLWIIGYTGTLQQQSGSQQLQERLKLEGVKINTSNNKVDEVYVRNIGDIVVNIDAVYLLGPSGVIDTTTGATTTLQPGDVATLAVNLGTLSEGTTYTIKVVTERGTEATYTFTYRKD